MSTEEQLSISTRTGADRVIFELEGELDLVSAPLLQKALAGPNLTDAALVVLDLRKLKFCDSTGLKMIFAARNESRERGQKFAVTRGSQQVERLLSVTRLNEHLQTIATPDEILE